MSFGNVYFILTGFNLQDSFCFLSPSFVVFLSLFLTAFFSGQLLTQYHCSLWHKTTMGHAIISGIYFQSLSRKIKSHKDNCPEYFSLFLSIIELFYDVGKWLLCPWLELQGFFMV